MGWDFGDGRNLCGKCLEIKISWFIEQLNSEKKTKEKNKTLYF